MYYLKMCAEALNQKNIGSFGIANAEEIGKTIQNAHVFVAIGPPNSEVVHMPVSDPMLSLPFDTCWFEVYNYAIASYNYGPNITHVILGALVKEISPNVFEFVLLINIRNDKTGESEKVIFVANEAAQISHKAILKVTRIEISNIINQMNATHDVGIVKTNERVKLKTPAGKVIHKIKKIIVIAPKKDHAKAEGVYTQIEWTHRWLVRGHWRKNMGLGKNRHGEYCVQGYTWVTEHVKGPEHAPLVSDKVRVIRNNP